MATLVTICSTQLSCRAEKTRDVLALYGNQVCDDAAIKEAELKDAKSKYEDLAKEIAYLNSFNANIESIDLQSMNEASILMAESLYTKQTELLTAVDASVSDILLMESELSNLTKQFDVVKEEVSYYNTLYTYDCDIPLDNISLALKEVEDKQVEYADAVMYGEIGDVTNVRVPVDGSYYISSHFGRRIDPLGSGNWDNHRGTDFAANAGTPVTALFSGTVTVADYHWGMGNYVRISHGDGIVSTYLHLLDIDVEEGQQVTQYDKIGTVGTTGKWSTGPHLHLALTINGEYVDPYTLFGG